MRRLDPPPGLSQANIYISRQALAVAPDAIGTRYPQAAGKQLIALRDTPRTELPAAAVPAGVKFGDNQLMLVGWELIDARDWQAALYWQALTPLADNYTISVRPLVGGQPIIAAGEPVIQDHQPVWGYYPTSRWNPGEIVRDVYALSLPDQVHPEAMQVVVYQTTADGFENLGDAIIPLAGQK